MQLFSMPMISQQQGQVSAGQGSFDLLSAFFADFQSLLEGAANIDLQNTGQNLQGDFSRDEVLDVDMLVKRDTVDLNKVPLAD